MAPPPPPVPKPRARYRRDGLNSTSSCDRDLTENPQPAAGTHLTTDKNAPPVHPYSGSDFDVILPTLVGVTNMIAANIPSLAGVAGTIGGSAPTPCSTPSAPPAIDTMANSMAGYIPSLAGTVCTVPNYTAATQTPRPSPAGAGGAPYLDNIVSSLANIPSLSGFMGAHANTTIPYAPPSADGQPHPPSVSRTGAARAAGSHTGSDIAALSQLVMSSLDPGTKVRLPSVDGAEEGRVAGFACWDAEEAESTDSSNEEEDTETETVPSPPTVMAPTGGDPAVIPAGADVPVRPPTPPPRPPGQTAKHKLKKTPRSATIRVSRKKGSSGRSAPQSAVARSSWLDIWKGFRHNVLWGTFDGQLMALWKKRTDQFCELLFHVSSITNVKKQDKRRFSVYFGKKHYDFMAHTDDIQDGWVTSLLASRGQPSPNPAKLHGQISMKDTRSKAYAAVWGHDLWIYPNKEGFQLGVASFAVPLNVASVKMTGKHSFNLITPYKTFSLSVDSSKDLSMWLESLSLSIRSALSCNQVTFRILENPCNKVCGDCSTANPEWASVNLLLVICQACAGHHRALGSNVSKVRSLTMDNKVWTEALIQLFISYGNHLASQVWAAAVPAAEQLLPESSDEERSKFIQDKYSRGCYRQVHPLASSQTLMDQFPAKRGLECWYQLFFKNLVPICRRLRDLVCSDDIEETMFLICSGAKVRQTDLQSPSPIVVAEKAGKALQCELLRLNEYTEVPPYNQSANKTLTSTLSGEEEEELHGKLEDDRFLFSVENNSATCDVLDLREVLSVFSTHHGPPYQFEVVTLNDHLVCDADDNDILTSHMVHILKVILPGGVSYAEVCGASAVSKVCMVEVGSASSRPDAWLLLWVDGVSVFPAHRGLQQIVRMELTELLHHEMDPSKNIITVGTKDRNMLLRFEEQRSFHSWFKHLQQALSSQSSDPCCRPAAKKTSRNNSLYPSLDETTRGSVPPAIERCISHINAHGLKVEGLYRRCGIASKVNRLVDALMTSPSSACLESDEQGVLDAGSALKQYVRQQQSLIPNVEPWLQAAAISDERPRFKEYQRLLQQLPDNNRATLSALFAHFYLVQVFSQVNKMSAQNLAVVLVPTLFQTLNQDLLRLTREFIIHQTLLFLTPAEDIQVEEEITVL